MVVDERGRGRSRSPAARGRSQSPGARCRTRSPQHKRPLRKTQSSPVQQPQPQQQSVRQIDVPTTPSTNTEFSASFPDFGSFTSAFPPFHSSDHTCSFRAFDDASLELFGHLSFPATSNHSTGSTAGMQDRMRASNHSHHHRNSVNNAQRRGRSHSPPRRTVSSPYHQRRFQQDEDEEEAPRSRLSWDELQKHRRKMSILLGDEQFPAADCSAFLGDFSLESEHNKREQQKSEQQHPEDDDSFRRRFSATGATDFPGVDLSKAAAQAAAVAAKNGNAKNGKTKKQQNKPKENKKKKKSGTTKEGEANSNTTSSEPSSPVPTKKKENATMREASSSKSPKPFRKIRKLMGGSSERSSESTAKSTATGATTSSIASAAASIAAMEVLERSAMARDKEELAQKIQLRRRQLILQPESQSTSATSQTSEADTTTTGATAGSPWDTQSKPAHSSKRRTSMQKLRNLVQPLKGTTKFHAMESMEDSTSSSLDFFFEGSFDATGSSNPAHNHEVIVRPVQLELTDEPPPSVRDSTSSSSSKNKHKKKQQHKHHHHRKQQPEEAPKPPTTTATKAASSHHSTSKSNKRHHHKKDTKQQHQQQSGSSGHNNKSFSDLPPLKSFQRQGTAGSASTGNTATTAASTQPMSDESDMSLSLSDLQRSERRTGGSSSSGNNSSGTATTAASSSMLSSSRSSKQQQFQRRTVADSSLDQPVYAPAALYHPQRAAVPPIPDGTDAPQQRSSTGTMLDSLALDTVHETLNEESSEATSRHSTASFMMGSSPSLVPQRTGISPPSSFSSNHSHTKVIPEDSEVVVVIENPPFGRQEQPKEEVVKDGKEGSNSKGQQQVSDKARRRERRPSSTAASRSNTDDAMDDGKSRGSRSKGKKKRPSTTSSSSNRKKDKSVSSRAAAPSKSRGEDVANRRPHSGRSPSPSSSQEQRRRRRSSLAIDGEKLSRSMNDVVASSSHHRSAGSSLSSHSCNPQHHKSDRYLRYPASDHGHSKAQKRGSAASASVATFARDEEGLPRGSYSSRMRKESTRRKSESYHGEHFYAYPGQRTHEPPMWQAGHQYARYVAEAEMAYFRFMQRRMMEMHEKQMGKHAVFPYSDHGGGYQYHHDPRSAIPPHSSGARLFCPPYPAAWGCEKPAYPASSVGGGDGFPTRGLRRRHSIGSGHSRDSVMGEISSAMEQEYRVSTCGHCGHVVSRCHCNAHHHKMEPFIDCLSRSRYARDQSRLQQQQQKLRDVGSTSNASAKKVSLFDTFGIKCLDSTTDSREKNQRRLDDEVHSSRLPSPGSVPLYHRPKGFDLNDSRYSTRAEKFVVEEGGGSQKTQLHRGRRIRGYSTKMPNTEKPQQQQVNEEDESIRYPPRTFSSSSLSGRSLERSCLDDESLVSFAI